MKNPDTKLAEYLTPALSLALARLSGADEEEIATAINQMGVGSRLALVTLGFAKSLTNQTLRPLTPTPALNVFIKEQYGEARFTEGLDDEWAEPIFYLGDT